MSATISRQQLRELAKKAGAESPLHALLASTAPRRPRARKGELPASLGRALELSVPMPASLSNASGRSRHWWTVAGNKKHYFRWLDERRNARLIPEPPSPPFGRCAITTTMYLGARMDTDNAMARHKWPLDWLQERGYLVNDRYVEWTGLPAFVIKLGQEYRIEIRLQEPTP